MEAEQKLNRKIVLPFFFALVLCGSLVATTHIANADADNPIQFYAFTLFSPLNKTYTSNALTLNLTFSAGLGIRYSLYYYIDGKYQEPIPFVIDNPNNEMHVIYPAYASINLPALSDGSHSLTIFLICAGLVMHPPSYNGTVYFTIDPSGRTLDLTPPKISDLSVENKTYTETDVPLNFTVNENTAQVAYSLDGKDNFTIAGNTTLAGLPTGLHNVTLYARDIAGNTGASETVSFTVVNESETEPFPIAIVAVVLATMLVVSIGLAVHFKKRNHQQTLVSTATARQRELTV